jgi:DNA-binding MarR family transcriptional regulator
VTNELTISPEPELESLLSDLVSVTQRLTRLAAQASGDTTSPAVWRTLGVLDRFGPMRLGQLAKQNRVSQPTMTKIVANLNESEWIRRIADVDDARAWQIALAPKGIVALAQWRSTVGAVLAPLFSDLSDADVDTLSRAVDLIHECTDAREERSVRAA